MAQMNAKKAIRSSLHSLVARLVAAEVHDGGDGEVVGDDIRVMRDINDAQAQDYNGMLDVGVEEILAILEKAMDGEVRGLKPHQITLSRILPNHRKLLRMWYARVNGIDGDGKMNIYARRAFTVWWELFFENRSYDEVAHKYKVTRERIRQIEAKVTLNMASAVVELVNDKYEVSRKK